MGELRNRDTGEMTDIIIRPLSFADAAQWRALRLEALRSYPTAFASAYEEALEQDLSGRIPPPTVRASCLARSLAARSQGARAARVARDEATTQVGALGMYVAPSLQRRGVGSALVGAVIEHARARVAVVQLTVLHANNAAKALYSRFGFVSYGIEKRALRHQGTDHDDELMALDLGNGL